MAGATPVLFTTSPVPSIVLSSHKAFNENLLKELRIHDRQKSMPPFHLPEKLTHLPEDTQLNIAGYQTRTRSPDSSSIDLSIIQSFG